MNVKAEDGSYIGAYSGAAAVNWQQGKAAQVTKRGKDTVLDSASGGTGEQTQVTTPAAPTTQKTVVKNKDGSVTTYDGGHATAAISGAIALNIDDQAVTSELSGVTITDAARVQNIAQKDGALVAAGLGLAATKKNNEGQSAFDATGAFSIDEATNAVDATIKGSTIAAENGVSNIAYDSDTQVAGGANVAFVKSGKTSAGLGASAAVNDVHNDIDATLTGSTVTSDGTTGTVLNHAAENLTQIAAAVGVAATTGGTTGVAIDASLASNNAKNELGATISNATLTAGSVDNAAYDADDIAKPFDQIIENNSVNATGSAYLDNATNNAATNGRDAAKTGDMTDRDYDVDLSSHGSTKQITAALSVSAATESGGVAGAGAAAIGTLQNTMDAVINTSTIDAKRVASQAKSDAVAVDVAAGVSVTGGTLSGAGSVAAQYTSDKTRAFLSNTQVTADDVTVAADSGNVDVTVAGQAGFGQNGLGLAVAFHHLGNTTGAYLVGSDVTAKTADGVAVTVAGTNHDTVVSVGAGVTGGETAAVNGSIAINQGNDDAEAIIDATTDKATGTKRRTNIKKARKLLAKAEDSSTKVAVAGAAVVGAGVAVNYDNTDSTAHVAGGTIAAKNVRVEAETKDKILNVGLGGTGAAYAGVTGSLGVNILGGHTRAAISDTALTGKTAGGATITSDGNVIVAAQRDGSIDNLAGVAAGSGLGASVGASVGGNVIATEVTADIDGAATSVTATGGTAETVSDRIADDAFLDGYPEGKSGALLPATYMKRKDSSYQGIAVSASSTNELNDRTLNLGLNGVGGSVNGNVAVNMLSGKTAANVSAGAVTANGADGTGTGDLHVIAHDYANSSAYTGAVALSGVGGSVGVGTTTTTVSRTTSATMTGTKGSSTAQANRIAIDADAKTALANLTATGAYTIAGLVGANVDNVTILSGKTEAAATGYDFTIGDGLDITARHGTNAYTLGALGAASLVSAGLGIDVMQDSSTTTAELTDGLVNTNNSGTGNVTVAAENVTKDNYKMITESAGYFGASTNVSAGNFNAQTTAHVADMTIGDADRRAGAVDIHAKNTTQVTSDTWDGAVAGVGIGAGIQIATIGSDTDARVENSTVYASAMDVTADDEKNGTFRLGNTLAGGLAGGVNVGVLTAGHKVEDTYSITGGDGTAHDSGADLTAVFSADGDVNTALKNSTLTESMTKGTGFAGPAVQTNNGADEHGEADAATTTASVTGGTLDATGDVTVTSNAAVNVKEENIYAAASLASFSGQVGVLDDAKQATVNVTDANIRGKNIALGTQLGGTSALDSYQGALGGIDVSGAFAFARSANSQGITLVGSTVTAGENVTVKTADDSTLKVHAYAVQPSLDVSASFQLAEADVVGATGITLGAGNAITAGKTIDIEAKSAPTIETDVKNTNDSLVFTGGVSVSTIETGDNTQHYKTNLTVADANKLAADSVRLAAIAAPHEHAMMQALSLTGSTNVTVNDATNCAYSDVTTDIGSVQYGTADQATALTIAAENNTTQEIKAASANAAGLTTVANNTANVVNVTNTTATANGAADGSNLKSVTIGAKQETTATADASSYGGAIALNVSAAETELSHTGTTTANVKGNWDVAGDVNVTAENKETFDLDTDTASASIAGGSGGGLSKNVTQAAHVNLDGAHRYEPHARKQRHAHGEFLCHERRGRAPRRQPHGGRRARRHADEHHERDVQPHAPSFFHRPGHRCEARPGERRDGRRGLVRLLRRGYGHRGRQGRRDGAAFRAALHALRLRRRLHHCDGWRQGDGRRHDREQGRHRRHGHGRRA